MSSDTMPPSGTFALIWSPNTIPTPAHGDRRADEPREPEPLDPDGDGEQERLERDERQDHLRDTRRCVHQAAVDQDRREAHPERAEEQRPDEGTPSRQRDPTPRHDHGEKDRRARERHEAAPHRRDLAQQDADEHGTDAAEADGRQERDERDAIRVGADARATRCPTAVAVTGSSSPTAADRSLAPVDPAARGAILVDPSLQVQALENELDGRRNDGRRLAASTPSPAVRRRTASPRPGISRIQRT